MARMTQTIGFSVPPQEEPYDEAWVMRLIEEAKEEERLHPMTQEEIEKEEEELRRYGAAQSKKLGIKEKDIDRLIHEFRARQRNQSCC
ncbi:MAG: hypothetical protein ACRERD_17560 [Candidatus Binatia bacterium]